MIPLYSIVIPVYNVESYIRRCVESVLCQKCADVEIILVDDGSTDNSANICDEFAAKYKEVIVVHKNNGGLSDARNVGIEKASGKYVIFLDSDDYWESDFLKRLNSFIDFDCDVFVIDAIINELRVLDHAKSLLLKKVGGKLFLKESLRQGKMPMAAWLYVYRLSFLKKNNLYFKINTLHEDEQFTPRALLLAKQVFYTGLNPYRYELRENSITMATDKRRNINDFFYSCQELEYLYKRETEKDLSTLLLDSLSEKYMSLYWSGKLYRFSEVHIPRKFLLRNSKKFKTKIKSILFVFCPRIYCAINTILKVY